MGRYQEVALLKTRGFTLIELLVVLLIIGAAYSLAAPLVFSGMTGTELKSSARQLAAGLRKARSEAVARGRETVLILDVAEHRFRLSGDERIYQLPKSIEINLFTAQSELINDKTASIRFYPDGGSTGGRITVAARDRKYAVDINWLTGQIVILD